MAAFAERLVVHGGEPFVAGLRDAAAEQDLATLSRALAAA
jgi:hypothetical protein